jgi:hypothetical protein
MTNGRVIAVFGSAGLRDKEKRRMMAETSAELADLTVLTAEDPRTESLEGILEEMAGQALSAQSKGPEEPRANFLAHRGPRRSHPFALRLARPGDIVLSCGKGHEQSMCFGGREFLWDDRTAMRAALAEFLGVEGPPMPYLPDAGYGGNRMVDMGVKPVVLEGRHVRLEPMTEAHIPGLAGIGVGQTFWDFMLYGNMDTEEDMADWVRDILARAEKGTDLPFAVIHLESGRVAGATRYLNIMPRDRGLEIGGTWYGTEFQRTAVNTECKYLLLKHAFETLGASACS